jgi:hypothetical protein
MRLTKNQPEETSAKYTIDPHTGNIVPKYEVSPRDISEDLFQYILLGARDGFEIKNIYLNSADFALIKGNCFQGPFGPVMIHERID